MQVQVVLPRFAMTFCCAWRSAIAAGQNPNVGFAIFALSVGDENLSALQDFLPSSLPALALMRSSVFFSFATSSLTGTLLPIVEFQMPEAAPLLLARKNK